MSNIINKEILEVIENAVISNTFNLTAVQAISDLKKGFEEVSRERVANVAEIRELTNCIRELRADNKKLETEVQELRQLKPIVQQHEVSLLKNEIECQRQINREVKDVVSMLFRNSITREQVLNKNSSWSREQTGHNYTSGQTTYELKPVTTVETLEKQEV